jgi:divalent metal cation (Fe/Co/Zn/Cd) transporter
MQSSTRISAASKKALYNWASVLALITIFYNLAEGLISVFFGLEDETYALFGFGLDSFVEVISGIGIWHMIKRLRLNSTSSPDRFEHQALRVTGAAFYLLAFGLVLLSSINVYHGHKPDTTFWGIIIALVSIITMGVLIYYKVTVGRKLNSAAILADANCTKTCLYLSVILLIASAGYELTGLGGIDAAGAVMIAIFSFREGREAFQKAQGKLTCGCSGGCHEQ